MRVDDATWVEIRRTYMESSLSVDKIAAQFKVGRSTIDRRILREKWAPRPSVRAIPLPPVAPVVAPAESAEPAWTLEPREFRGAREPDTPAARALRLLRLIDLQLDHMETRMTSGEPMTAQDQERQARAFGAVLGHLETVTETAIGTDTGRTGGVEPKDGGHLEAERLRREIAERLERLNAQWLAQTKSL